MTLFETNLLGMTHGYYVFGIILNGRRKTVNDAVIYVIIIVRDHIYWPTPSADHHKRSQSAVLFEKKNGQLLYW